MQTIAIANRTITVSHVGTTSSEYGDIQRYRVSVSGSAASTEFSSLRPSRLVDARVLASVIDTELLLDYEGSRESGLLRDAGTVAWRDQSRPAIEAALRTLREVVADMPPEPISDIESSLLREIGRAGEAPGHTASGQDSDPAR
ncbi:MULTISPECIES: hypothetical protein [unclassified Microbacterium]|uniref:hypothetical protein n=1 Tax=unclassified Microbacterium TaxID=2609290 RepID=UPI0030192B4D